MINLEKIRDYKLLKKPIKTLTMDTKNIKKDQFILHIGKDENSFKNFLDSGLLVDTNFRGYFIEKLLVSNNKKIRRFINPQTYYKELKESTKYPLNCKLNVSAFKNLNLLYDLTPLALVNSESSKQSYLIKMKDFFQLLYDKFVSFNYKTKVIVFNIDGMSQEDKDSYLFYFQYVIKRKFDWMLEWFNGITFIIMSPNSKAYFKFTFTEETFNKKPIITARINALQNDGTLEELIKTDGENDKPDEEINTEIQSSSEHTSFANKIATKEEIKDEKKTKVKEVLKTVGVEDVNDDNDSDENEIKKTIDRAVEDIVEQDEENNMTEEELMNILLNKEEFKKSLIAVQAEKLDGHRKQNAEQLKIQQDKLKFKDVSLKDIQEKYKEKKIDKKDVDHGNIKNVINKEILTSSLKSFDDTYMEKKFNRDIAKVLESFNNDSDIGVYVKDIKLTPNNTDMNKQNMLEVEFKDDTNVSHKFKVNIPEVKDGKFMYVNGNKKVIMKQLTFMPIVKLDPDRVQITTNYNKHFIVRFGQRFSEKLDYLKKIFTKSNLKQHKKSGSNFDFKFGNSLKTNGPFLTTAEYTDISSYLYELDIDDYTLIFDQQYLHDILDVTKQKYNEKIATKAKFDNKLYFMVGYTNDKKKLVLSNIVNKMVYLYDGKNYENLQTTLSSWIINMVYKNTTDKIKDIASDKIKTNTKLTYSRIELNNKVMPVVVILGYELGLMNLMDRYEIEYQFDAKNRSLSVQDDMGKIRFKDGYLYYDTSKIRNSMLLSGLLEMDTENIVFADMNNPEPYLDYFQDAFNSRNAAKGFHNSLSLMIDPITKDILEELNQPTNVYDVLLYANTLLEDVSYTEPSDVNNFRVRGAEQIPAMLYKVYADAFKHYKDSKHAKNPVKITVDPDIVIKKLMELKTIENYSSLNPSLELERMGTASMKGLAGINVNEAYTKRVRAYNANMKDLIALNTPEGNQVGIVRQLTYDPKISNIYGFIDAEQKGNGSTSQYDVSELMNVSTTTHADAPRVSMQSVQQKHIISVKEQTAPLIGSGIEKTAPYMISDEFAFKAKEDGIVEKIDYKNKVAILKYKSGKQDLIDLDVVETNNSNGGFYVSQTFQMLYSQNEKFTKGSVIAKNPLFFSGDGKNEDLSYTLGKLTKVAIASGDFTLEDSSMITESMSEAMSTKVTMRKVQTLDRNATVSYIASEGAHINTNDPLIIFENSFNDDSISSVLGKIGTEFEQDIAEMAKNELKCKYTGTIKKINIYYTDDIEVYSPSIQKIIKDYISTKKSRKAIIEKIKGTGYDSLNAPILDKQTDTKVKGEELDGVMFEFFIEYYDDLSIGDKIIYGTALKTIVSNVMNKGEEPYSEYNPDENVEAVLSPLSINSRMTLDVFIDGYTSKALVELKRQIKKIYES